MYKSFEVVDGGTSASAVAAPDVSAVSALVEEGGRGNSTKWRTSRMHRINSQMSSPRPKEYGTYGSNNMNRLTRRKTI